MAAAVAIAAAAVGKPSALVLKPLPAEGFFMVHLTLSRI
jgi:hypothetical protein